MGFKETLHKIVHHDEFDHRPSLEELKETPLIGGDEHSNFINEYPEAEETELKLFDPDVIPEDFMPYAHNRHRRSAWRGLHQTQLDDGEEWC